MLKTWRMPYGNGTVPVTLPEEQVLAELHGNRVQPIDDIALALKAAVEEPIDSVPLRDFARPGEKIVLVVSDMSRFWMRQDLVIPHLVDYLLRDCGVAAGDLTILVANGTHPGGDEKELRTLVTDGVYDRVRVVNHDCLSEDAVRIGTTSFGTEVKINAIAARADKVITLGACTHHVMAGFGGGRKSIVPGIAALSTIRQNHAWALDKHALKSNADIGNGKTEGNPFHLDMAEAAGMVKNLFIVNLVMNAEMKLANIYAGHYLTSWRRGCERVNEIYRVPVREKADVIVASCGGFPKDMSLYQGTKTIDNVETGLKEGGTLVLVIEAREGGGPEEYFGWIKPLQDGTMEEKLRTGFTVPGYVFLLNCEQAARYRVMMLSSVPAETVAPMGLESYPDWDSLRANLDLEGKSIYVIPNGATVVPFVEEEK